MAAKKSLFSKPKWAATASNTINDDKAIFKQNVYKDIIQAERNKEEKRLAKLKKKEEEEEQRRKHASESRDTKVDEDRQPVKKQRISTEPAVIIVDEDDDFNRRESDSDSIHSSKSSRSRKGRDSSRSRSRSATPTVRKGRKPTLRSAPKEDSHGGFDVDYVSPKKATKIFTSEAEDSDIAIINIQPSTKSTSWKARSKARSPPLPVEAKSDTDSEEDEYLRELKRQARAEKRAKEVSASTTQNLPTEPYDSLSPSLKLPHGSRDTKTPTPIPDDADDPIVHIRITSMIPSTTEQIVSRRASQPLDQVLSYFISKHEITPQLASKIFFTWNGTKLYKSTTMRSILNMIQTKYKGLKDADGKIQIEATTQEIFDFKQQQKERARRGEYDEDADTGNKQVGTDSTTGTPAPTVGNDPASTQQQQQRGPGTVINLKSQDDEDLPPMTLRVHPPTTIERIVRGYKKRMGVDLNRDVYLVFDGDVLEAAQTVADIGLEEGDSIDVRAR